MRGNLAKAPLVAVLYASLLHFTTIFLPFTLYYREARYTFAWSLTWLDNLWLVAYALFVCLVAALAFAAIEQKGMAAFLRLMPIFLGLGWIMPMLQPFLLGTPAALTEWDILMHFAGGVGATILMLLLSTFLYSRKPVLAEGEEPPKKEKVKGGPRKFKLVRLTLFMLLALPFAFFIFYFVGWYFLAWREDALRAFYGGPAETSGFFFMLISTLLERPMEAGLTLLRGFLLAAFSLLLLLNLSHKKLMFIVISVLLFLSPALFYLIPTALMPWEVRLPHLIFSAAHLLLFSVLCAFLLPLALNKGVQTEEVEEEAAAPAEKGKKPVGTGKPIPAKAK